jgi:hypothetical protein
VPRVTKESLTHQSPITHSTINRITRKSAIGARRRKVPRVAIPLVLPSLESIARYRVSAVVRRVVKTRWTPTPRRLVPRERNRPLTRRSVVSAVLSNSNAIASRVRRFGSSVNTRRRPRASPAGWSAAGFGIHRCVPREHLQILRRPRVAARHTAATCHRRRHRSAGGGVASGRADFFRGRRPTACLRSHALRVVGRHTRSLGDGRPCLHNRVVGLRATVATCVPPRRHSRKGIATETRSGHLPRPTRNKGKKKTRPR